MGVPKFYRCVWRKPKPLPPAPGSPCVGGFVLSQPCAHAADAGAACGHFLTTAWWGWGGTVATRSLFASPPPVASHDPLPPHTRRGAVQNDTSCVGLMGAGRCFFVGVSPKEGHSSPPSPPPPSHHQPSTPCPHFTLPPIQSHPARSLADTFHLLPMTCKDGGSVSEGGGGRVQSLCVRVFGEPGFQLSFAAARMHACATTERCRLCSHWQLPARLRAELRAACTLWVVACRPNRRGSGAV
jgi:hypothetical protein